MLALSRQSSSELDELEGVEVISHGDHTAENILAVAAKIADTTDRIDLLLHNASLWETDPEIDSERSEAFDRAYAVHMRTPSLLNHRLLSLLQAPAQAGESAASIVYISDARAEHSDPRHSQYTATKAAVNSLVRSEALEYAPQVRVNAIAPGPLLLSDFSTRGKEATLARIPLGFLPGFEPLHQALDFVIHNTYLTGSVLRLDGGRML